MKRMEGRTAVVTGSGQGIGEAIAFALAAEGAVVILADRVAGKIARVRHKMAALGYDCLAVETDITVKEDVQTLFAKARDSFGKVDILVNNAGTIRPAPFLSMTEEDWDFIQRVDLKGLMFCTQAAAPMMMERKYGKIVNISSMSAYGVYMPGFASYSAAKAAVNNFTQYSARELGVYGITVNGVAPGEILTDLTYQNQTEEEVKEKLKRSTEMTMLKRLGQTEDVAKAVCFLASEDSSFITGVTISVDGGRIDRM